MVTQNKTDQLRLRAGIGLLADRKGVPVSEIASRPLAKIEADIRAARVTTWDIAREVVISRNMHRLYERFNIPPTMLVNEAIEEGYLERTDALSCYAVMPNEIEAVIKEYQWVA